MLYETIRKLKKEVSIIYISHKLDEVFQISDWTAQQKPSPEGFYPCPSDGYRNKDVYKRQV